MLREIFNVLRQVWLYILALYMVIADASCIDHIEKYDDVIGPGEKTYTVKGYILDGQDQPVDCTQVVLYEKDARTGYYRIVKCTTRTDSNGFYKIDFTRHQDNVFDYKLSLEYDRDQYPSRSYFETSRYFSFAEFDESGSLDFNIYFLKHKASTSLHYRCDVSVPKNETLFYDRKTNLLIDGKPYDWGSYLIPCQNYEGEYFVDQLYIPELSNHDLQGELCISLYYWNYNYGKKIVCKEDTIKLNLNRDIPSEIYHDGTDNQ